MSIAAVQAALAAEQRAKDVAATQARVAAGVGGGAGLQIESLQQVLQYFCERRRCRRKLVDLTLRVEGIGELVVKPGQFVADVVGAFGAEHKVPQEQLQGTPAEKKVSAKWKKCMEAAAPYLTAEQRKEIEEIYNSPED